MFVKALQEDLADTGYFRTLDLIAGFASTPLGSQKVRELRPLADLAEINSELNLVSSLRTLMEGNDGFHMPPYTDISDHLEAIRGRIPVLEPLQLRDIAKNIRATISLRKRASFITMEMPELAFLFNQFQPNSLLASSVEDAIDENGEVLDRASSALRSIRRRLGTCRESIGKALKNYITKVKADVQEEIVTTRSSRYVVLMKAGAKARNQGIVHDESGSGQAVYFEPLKIFEMNNELASLRAAERDEILRILRELTVMAATSLPALEADFAVLMKLDTVYARANFSSRRLCSVPQLGKDLNLSILSARHPLLGDRAVPVDVVMPEGIRFLIISGPNAGGKSVALKLVALMCMMAQTGIPIPASADTSLPLFDRLQTDIGDKQSIESDLSTFSSHIVTLDRITRKAARGTLVLIDEICDGTDPEEASALAMGVVRKLKDSGAFCLITSHYSPLKVFAMEEQGVTNGAMAFDEDTLSPTFKLKIGLPGKSYGIAIAQRMGMEDEVINTALNYLSGDRVRVEDVVAGLERTRTELELQLEEAEKSRQQAQILRQELETRLEEIRNSEQVELMELFQSNLREICEEKQRIAAMVDELRRMVRPEALDQAPAREPQQPRPQDSVTEENIPAPSAQAGQGKAALKALGAMEEMLRRRMGKVKSSRPAPSFQRGAKVMVTNLNQKGVLMEERADGTWLVEIGSLRMSVKQSNLRLLDQGAAAGTQQRTDDSDRRGSAMDADLPALTRAQGARADAAARSSFSPVLDLRGEYVEEGLLRVERFLVDAITNDMGIVRIIHGKGTGKLRRAVTDYLKTSALVESFRLADYNDGGSGVTVVKVMR